MCASCALAGRSRCHRRAADCRGGAFSSTALRATLHAAAAWTFTLHLAAAWTPSGRGRELRAPSASKSPNSTPRVANGPLLEALSCSRGIGVPSLPPSCCRVWHLQKVAKIQCISRRRRLRLLGASRREPNDALGEMTLPAGTRSRCLAAVSMAPTKTTNRERGR